MNIESKLDAVIEAKGLSVDQLIEKTGLTRMTIFNARRGLNVTINTALKIAEALEVSMHDIWSSENIDKEESSADLPPR